LALITTEFFKHNSKVYLLSGNSGQAPTWNFFKFLLDGDGKVIDVWGPRVSVRNIKDDITRAIEKLKRSHSELWCLTFAWIGALRIPSTAVESPSAKNEQFY